MARRVTYEERRDARGAIDDPQVVLEAAVRFLEPRARSVDEVRRRLVRAGYRPELVTDAIERLLELGMLDDEAFARAWLASRDRAHPRGEHAIRTELARKGVDRVSIDLVLEERREAWAGRAVDGHGDDEESPGATADLAAAERLLAKNRRVLSRVSDPRRRRARAYALLARNGFDPETSRDLAARAAEEPLNEEPED
jgi:regulatory protein